jgi:hypothetical protein
LLKRQFSEGGPSAQGFPALAQAAPSKAIQAAVLVCAGAPWIRLQMWNRPVLMTMANAAKKESGGLKRLARAHAFGANFGRLLNHGFTVSVDRVALHIDELVLGVTKSRGWGFVTTSSLNHFDGAPFPREQERCARA